ncbi:hypothetical protein EH243_18265 [Amphritea opalescens]|uniref:Uncharacterized protein n=1 Tax=Amphritea opalescens TaxID=2490544 RepID=A0A430KLB4_9GAMM|nr:hypothetical protein [Amphritea opalescens]RTE64268.1 hypothetical protein EH243_18265 [Amphritea opalescens]
MSEDKYQITEKAQYLNLLILKDELQSFDTLLSEAITDADTWLSKLRATRGVFLTLNNVKDIADRLRINGSTEFTLSTRSLRKDLMFANHFRNRGIGHLNDILLKRAAQWSPQIFYESFKDNNSFKLIEAHRTIIESCINSYIDKDGRQKVFDTEIDLMYPPDAKQFYSYLSALVTKSVNWLNEASKIILSLIVHHTNEEIQELAAIAGQTNFDLKSESEFSYSIEEHRINFAETMKVLKERGTDPKILEVMREKFEI